MNSKITFDEYPFYLELKEFLIKKLKCFAIYEKIYILDKTPTVVKGVIYFKPTGSYTFSLTLTNGEITADSILYME